jgi:hypothetical protein
MGASLGVFDGMEVESVHTLRPRGERRGSTSKELPPADHSIT